MRLAPAALAIALSLAACRPEQQLPPVAPLSAPAPLPAPPPSPAFVVTENSDEWVTRTFHIQPRPARVLVVSPGDPPQTVHVAPLDLNARTAPAGGEDLPVAKSFHTLQEAADAAEGGDLVAVMPGTYQGFALGDKPSAGDARYIHVRAMGKPGAVVIDRPAHADGDRWMIYLRSAHHVVIEGMNLTGHDRPGDMTAAGPWAGIMLDGDFGRSGKLTHHVAVIGNYSHHHSHWGLHSTDTHSVLIQDNLFAFSAREHSAYVSDGSDNYVIRRNVFFGSFASGLQINLDPESSLEETLKHARMRDYPKRPPTRAWAVGLMKLASERFGENNFPDGRGLNFIVEENVINQNGLRGGGALNLAGLQSSLIQNNLLYDNHAHGIAEWDNANPYDAPAIDSPPASAAEDEDERAPIWGCRENVIRNNTVVMSNALRAAVQCHHGSWGCRVYNNLLVNDTGPSIEVDAWSIRGFEVRANAITRWTDDGMAPGLRSLATVLPEKGGNAMNVTEASAAAEMVRASREPWVIVEDGWWRLNPQRPDFRPRKGSALLAGKGDAAHMAPRDLEGRPRATPDIGAFAQ